ncbi:hypothetical protein [Tsukamurella soli]|uniref:Ferrous iron transport protein A n=1 Tax=Tsukamurella soli TaxID=644556 RepID=A0ABP8JQ65_9ACTN
MTCIVSAAPDPDGYATRITLTTIVRRGGPDRLGALALQLAGLPPETPVRISLFDGPATRIHRVEVQDIGGEYAVVLVPEEPEVI